jgi:hypothetical protein
VIEFILDSGLSDERHTFTVHERSEKNSIRYCLKCKKYKPDRTHHCKFCNGCTLKMDHHCPWVGNCIGFKNYKFFLNMIFYALVNSIYFNYIFSDVIRYLIIEEKIVSLKLLLFLSLYFFMIMVMLSLAVFNLFHFWITLKNYTTFEFVTTFVRGKENPNSKRSKYDISIWENFKQVYGWNPIFWLLPIDAQTYSNTYNGMNFKVNSKFEYEIIKSF